MAGQSSDSCYIHRISEPLYEQEALPEIIGDTLRPGGIQLTSEMIKHWSPEPGATVLDVGCGPGHSLAHLRATFGLGTAGLDPSTVMLEKAAQCSPESLLIEGTATAIPCKKCSFDGLLSECSLSLTGDTQKSLLEMYRVLKAGGMLLLSDIYLKNSSLESALPQWPKMRSCINHAQPLNSIMTQVKTAGFTPIILWDRTNLLKQLAGQIIFNCGSLEKFWQLFMDHEAALQTCSSLKRNSLGYYVIIARKWGVGERIHT